MNDRFIKAVRYQSRIDSALALLPALILALLLSAMVSGSGLDERTVTMRYLLFTLTGVLAFVLPYISFPDPRSRRYQLANFSPGKLLREYLLRHRPIWGTSLLLILVTAFADGRGLTVQLEGKILLAVYGLFFFAGIYLYAACRYLRIGRESQIWQEGQKGAAVRKRFAEVAHYPIDPGSIPSLISTVLIALIGMMGVVAGAWGAAWLGATAEAGIAILLFLLGGSRVGSMRTTADSCFYQSNAFFSEFFGIAEGPGTSREPLKTEQLWWVPHRWRSHAWALMLQMDRKLPAGRMVAVGHLIIWAVAYQGADRAGMMTAWIVFAILHHGFLLLTVNQAIAPRWWLRLLDRPVHWSLARFWIQARWTLPLVVSMIVLNWLFPLLSRLDMGGIVLAYLGAGALFSFILSLRYERVWING